MKHFRQRSRYISSTSDGELGYISGSSDIKKTKNRHNVQCNSEQRRECFTGKVGNTIDTPALCQCSLGALASKLGVFWVSQPQNECILGTPDIKPGVYPTFLSKMLEIYPTSLSEVLKMYPTSLCEVLEMYPTSLSEVFEMYSTFSSEVLEIYPASPSEVLEMYLYFSNT